MIIKPGISALEKCVEDGCRYILVTITGNIITEYYDDNNVNTLTNYIKNGEEYKEIEKYEYEYYTNNTMSGKPTPSAPSPMPSAVVKSILRTSELFAFLSNFRNSLRVPFNWIA